MLRSSPAAGALPLKALRHIGKLKLMMRGSHYPSLDAAGGRLLDAGREIHLRIPERAPPLRNPPVMNAVGSDDPAQPSPFQFPL